MLKLTCNCATKYLISWNSDELLKSVSRIFEIISGLYLCTALRIKKLNNLTAISSAR